MAKDDDIEKAGGGLGGGRGVEVDDNDAQSGVGEGQGAGRNRLTEADCSLGPPVVAGNAAINAQQSTRSGRSSLLLRKCRRYGHKENIARVAQSPEAALARESGYLQPAWSQRN